MTLLVVDGVSVEYPAPAGGSVRAVDAASFSIESGRTVGLVGESGSGKTTLALTLMGLLPPGARIVDGSVTFDGRDVTALDDESWRALRWSRIALVFQGSMNALNPVQRVLAQVSEPIRAHDGSIDRAEARRRAGVLLERVGIPRSRWNGYPHQYSGGMRQRAGIAMALACRPTMLIADEPVTALDVIVQAQIMQLLRELQEELGLALLVITHDLGVVAQLCHDVVVMYAGEVVESGPSAEVFADPKHPYTSLLLASVPRFEPNRALGEGVPGVPASAANPPAGCRLHPRCPFVREDCLTVRPLLRPLGPERLVRCHLYD
jgi:oligopeptide/dipeptide ABC transporter ATP-binding protein